MPSTCTRHVRHAPSGARSGSLQSCGSVTPAPLTASSTVAPAGSSTGRPSIESFIAPMFSVSPRMSSLNRSGSLLVSGLVLDIVVTVGIGFVLGFLIGLTGVGGGALVAPALYVILGMSYTGAVAMSLVYSFFTKIVGLVQHVRLG